MSKRTKALLSGALIILVIVINTAMRYGPDWVYFVGDALCWLLISLVVLYNTKGYIYVLAQLLVTLTASNLVDELITDPTVINFSEVAIAILGVSWVIWKVIQIRKEKSIQQA